MSKIIGMPLSLAGVLLLIWNEYHHVHAQRLFAEARQHLVELTDTTDVDAANEGKLVFFDAWTCVGDSVFDPLYGVGGHFMAVQRHTQYYQWVEKQERRTYRDAEGNEEHVTHYYYVHQWAGKPVNSDNFHGSAPESHRNLILTEIPSAKFYSQGAGMGPYLLHHQLIDSVPPLHPGLALIDTTSQVFAQALDSTTRGGRVPHHLCGDTIYYGHRPHHPVVGDVRVTFSFHPACRAWVLAQPHGRQLQPFQASDGYWLTFCRFGTASFDPREAIDLELWGNKWLVWTLRVLGWLMVVGGIYYLFSWLAGIFGRIPLLGPVLDMGINAVVWIVGTVVSVILIGLTFVVVRPWLGLTILGVVAALIVGLHLLHKRTRRVPPPVPSSSMPPPLPPQ